MKAETQLDFLGRVWRESTLMPDGQWSVRVHHHDSAGRQDWVSVPESSGAQPPTNSFNPANMTVWSNFDAFGRAGTITAADGKITTISYTGVRQVDRTVAVAGVASTTREIYDGFGRLYQLFEPGSTGSPDTPNSTTTYTYDLKDRLIKSVMDTGGTPQIRSFTYDNRGFLEREVHPELVLASQESGTTAYSNFDARGHAEYRKVNESEDIFDLHYVYDAAERLTDVESRDPNNATTYRASKEFHFGQAGPTNGKLTSAVRHNYVPGIGEVMVTESYEYGDDAGRLTKKTTNIHTVNGSPDPLQQTLDQSYTYDDLGEMTGISYPGDCVPGPCGINDYRTSVSFGYEAGRLNAVPGFAASIAYAPSGAPSVITHANGVVDSITPDVMGRPSTISFAGTGSCTVPTLFAPDVTVPYSSSATLSASAGGTAPFAYQWHSGGQAPTTGNKIAGATGPAYTIPSVTASASYWIVVANSCGSAQRLVTVTPSLGQPTGLVATASGTSVVNITWTPSGASHHFLIWRQKDGKESALATSITPSFDDHSVVADTSYVYRVQAADAGTGLSASSNRDLATTMTFTPVVAGNPVLASEWNKLLEAVNAVRLAGLWTTLRWEDLGTAAPASDSPILAAQLAVLRASMTAALQHLSLPAPGYTDPVVDDSLPIKAIHVIELQQRVR